MIQTILREKGCDWKKIKIYVCVFDVWNVYALDEENGEERCVYFGKRFGESVKKEVIEDGQEKLYTHITH